MCPRYIHQCTRISCLSFVPSVYSAWALQFGHDVAILVNGDIIRYFIVMQHFYSGGGSTIARSIEHASIWIPRTDSRFFFYISGKYWWVEIYNAISFKWSISDRSVVFIYLFVRVVHLFIQMKRSSRADRQNITFSMFFTVSQNLQWHLHTWY